MLLFCGVLYQFSYFHVSPFTRQSRHRAWVEMYMGSAYSAPSFCTVNVRTQPVVSKRREKNHILMYRTPTAISLIMSVDGIKRSDISYSSMTKVKVTNW